MAGKKGSGGGGLENLSLPGKIAVAVVFMLMVGAAYFVVFYGEIDGDIAAQIQAKTAKEGELNDMHDADRAYTKDRTELERRKHIVVKQKKILPDESEWAPFLDTLQRSATISGVTLSGWDPQSEVTESFFVKVPMKVKVKGRYHQIAKFFYSVGQSDRIINMANIEMKIDQSSQRSRDTTSTINEGEESILVNVSAMATAFRAVGADEGNAGGRRGRRGRTGGAQ